VSQSAALTGYLHPAYANALAEFGTPRHLPHSDGWLLARTLAGRPERDAMGCYPLFACRDWARLRLDLAEIGGEFVSLVLVADPFGAYEPAELRRCFPDLCVPFKEHFVIDLAQPLRAFVNAHHQRNARKALQVLAVERCPDPTQLAGAWNKLYATLIARHGIKGLTAFSPRSFARQLQVPGLSMFCARHEGEIVGMTLWYSHDAVGYYHLGAYSERGYELRASFALFWRTLEYFAGAGLHWLDLGAGVGLKDEAADGLSRFKRGWATATRTAYLCGRIFDAERYAALTRARGAAATDYFPAYRKGEFN
jgi:Acetyltransferase (GNAT) domain